MRKKSARSRKTQAKETKKTSRDVKLSTTPYDDAWRTLTTNLPKLLIPMVNEVFGSCFTNRAKVVLRQNEHMFSKLDGETEKRITDTNFSVFDPSDEIKSILGNGFRIYEGAIEKRYIFECESKPVTPAVLIRFVEYSVKSGTELGSVDGKAKLTISIPKIAILSLRTTENTPSEMVLEIQMENGSANSPVRIMKLSDYDSDSIFEKQLYLLIPFLLFNYEKRFQSIEENDDAYRALMEKFKSIYYRIDDIVAEDVEDAGDTEDVACSQLLDLYTSKLLREITHTVVNGLTKKYPKIRKGVNAVVGGNIIITESTRILQKGIREGQKEGAANAWNEMAERMVSDGEPGDKILRYTRLGRKEIDTIAQRLNRTVVWNETSA